MKNERTTQEIKGINLVVEKECFKWGDVKFEEEENGKTKCGVCQAEFQKLISHLNVSPECNIGMNMEKFKIEFTKYRAKMRRRKYVKRQKQTDLDAYRENLRTYVRKTEQKKKTENLDHFRESKNLRVSKSKQKKRAEDLEMFRENLRTSVRNTEQKEKN